MDSNLKLHPRPAGAPPTILDLFAGAGGFSEGFHLAGVEAAVANEIDIGAAATYALNHAVTLIVGDIAIGETKEAICRAFADQPCDVLVGGVPCQPWSRAGKRTGFEDLRGCLWLDYLEMVDRLRPQLAVAENVVGLLDQPDALKTIIQALEGLGYKVKYRVLNAADFGVPQRRKRLFLVGNRTGRPFIWPTPRRSQ